MSIISRISRILVQIKKLGRPSKGEPESKDIIESNLEVDEEKKMQNQSQISNFVIAKIKLFLLTKIWHFPYRFRDKILENFEIFAIGCFPISWEYSTKI